jgi:hypothetical protein
VALVDAYSERRGIPVGRALTPTSSAVEPPADFVRRTYLRCMARGDDAHLTDAQALIEVHGQEIRQTLEVVDVVTTEAVAISLVRYSIGPNIYKDSVWLRKVGSAWRYCSTPQFAVWSEDSFEDGQAERAKKMIGRAAAWEKESARRWW